MSQTRAVIELILAAMLWGLGFVAAVWSLEAAGPLAISAWRFIIAGAIGLYFLRGSFFLFKGYLRAAWLPGALIAATVGFQTWGLQYTTATKSGFITCLYALIVPLFEPLFGGPKPRRSLIVYSGLALFGVAMMCGLFTSESLDEKSKLNIGDGLTLICAFAASGHIFSIARIHGKLGHDFNGFHFNTVQSFAAGLPALGLALVIEPGAFGKPLHFVELALADVGPTWLPLMGFISLTIFSTLIGFALQIRAQRALSPTTASLLFLLESPFAAVFAMLLLGEVLGPSQLLGGALILAAVAASTVTSLRPHPIV